MEEIEALVGVTTTGPSVPAATLPPDYLAAITAPIPQINRASRRFRSLDDAREKLGVPIDESLRGLFEQPFFEQGSDAWHLQRHGAITASDFGAAAGCAEYGNAVAVFRKKVEHDGHLLPARALPYVEHGKRYEDCAAFEYERRTGNTIIDFGLLTHCRIWDLRPRDTVTCDDWFYMIHANERPECISEADWALIVDLRWLKGSPDGITTNGILIEIKCPVGKIVEGQLKQMYRAQVQLNMEVANVSTCHFIQYRPPAGMLHGDFDMFTVDREPDWFQLQKTSARKCWEWVQTFRTSHQLADELAKRIKLVPDPESRGRIFFASTRAPPKRRLFEVDEDTEPQQQQSITTSTYQFLPFTDDDSDSTTTTAIQPAPITTPFQFLSFADDDEERVI